MAKTQKAPVQAPVISKIEEEPKIDLTGRYARIVTRGRVIGGGAIWHRAKIVRETPNTILITYVSKTDHETGKIEVKSTLIKKIDIVELQLFAE